jgi:hypothetical protein
LDEDDLDIQIDTKGDIINREEYGMTCENHTIHEYHVSVTQLQIKRSTIENFVLNDSQSLNVFNSHQENIMIKDKDKDNENKNKSDNDIDIEKKVSAIIPNIIETSSDTSSHKQDKIK